MHLLRRDQYTHRQASMSSISICQKQLKYGDVNVQKPD